MSEPQVPEMHAEFLRWYRTVDLGDDRDRLQRRWNGVSSLVAKATTADIEAMVRIALRTRHQPATDASQQIRKHFKDTDDQFQMEGNSRELEVLCGAALTVLLTKGTNAGAIAALSTTTAALGGARQRADLPMDLPSSGEHAVLQIANSLRARPDLARSASSDIPKFDFERSAAKSRESGWENVAQAFGLAAETVKAIVSTLARRQVALTEAATRFMRLQDEELQMLWWLSGQRSWELDRPFDSVAAEVRTLVLAKELADLTQFLPGPASVRALLSRAGLKDGKKTTVPVAVNACNAQWLSNVTQGKEPSPVSQPIHFAIRRKLETGDDETWIAGWAGACGVDATHGMSSLALGTLFYRERLLVRFP